MIGGRCLRHSTLHSSESGLTFVGKIRHYLLTVSKIVEQNMRSRKTIRLPLGVKDYACEVVQ